MRRGLILVSGFGVSFVILWFLCCGCIAVLTDLGTSVPVVDVAPTGARETGNPKGLPMSVSGTCLLAEQIVMYEGAYLQEHPSDETVCVTALLLRNTGQQGIVYATVILEAEGVQLVFEADTIPPGEAVLVLEKNKHAVFPEEFISCTGSAVTDASKWDDSDDIKISCIDMGTVAVSNPSDKVLVNIYLYYKNYISDPGFYVGGQSHMYLIERLEPGQTIYIYPAYYAKGYTRFARIEITQTQ